MQKMIIDEWKTCDLKKCDEHWKYNYDYNLTFTSESNFGIK